MAGDGAELRRALQIATQMLEARAVELNALNVFPVPDGDTGTNMVLTMQAALLETESLDDPTVANVTRAAARGALLGARGNSGVITSRFLHGFAQALADAEGVGAHELARALDEAARTAYLAVTEPVEGTMLTVGRDLAQAACAAAAGGGDRRAVFEAAVVAGRASVARTPDLLPILRQAGVVDAGGLGLLAIVEGMAHALVGMPVKRPEAVAHPIAAKRLGHGGDYGYCTEFLIVGKDLNVEQIRQRLGELGDSLIAVGDPDLVRVHIHAVDPGPVLSYAASLGSLSRIKIDNMQEQNEQLLAKDELTATSAGAPSGWTSYPGVGPAAAPEAATPFAGLSVVVVAAGSGFEELFRSLGAAVVVPGGQTMNPSTQDILRGVEAAPGQQVVVLPNNKNVLLAAQEVCRLTTKQVVVVPTCNMAEGVAALMAVSYEADLPANARRLEQAARALASGEVTRAIRAARFDGFTVREGDMIGLVDRRIVCVGETVAEVALELVARLGGDDAEVITLYHGADLDAAAARQVAVAIRQRWPDAETELVAGNQPHYHLIIAVE